ncbi:chalcone isomerase family protein [Hydrogenophaga sp. PAMC20947]|uniref:chalcone isomerase family protein n=1 Tax=Hydrogenophaga sp. PAMC20947 TaxID=2565558 RepID=UPI00109E31A9|nr:chalcone isomerase family protein [Hydrogenophaga sp. PAMC20947]QCB47292.1 hypothetical protein E5678_15420 [Hydrogenophaga sp. PAMC20947]
MRDYTPPAEPQLSRRHVLAATSAAVMSLLAFPLTPAQAQGQPAMHLGQISSVLRQPRLRGEAQLRFFGFSVYQARLWTEPEFEASAYADHPLVLELLYARSLQSEAIAERSLTEMQRGRTISREQGSTWLAAMRRTFPDVSEGDRLTGMYRPGQATHFEFNGQLRAPVNDKAFGPAFFGIWLAESTSEPAMRRQLLGLDTKAPR